MRWDEEKLNTFIDMKKAGATAREIADVLGCDEQCVYDKAKRMKQKTKIPNEKSKTANKDVPERDEKKGTVKMMEENAVCKKAEADIGAAAETACKAEAAAEGKKADRRGVELAELLALTVDIAGQIGVSMDKLWATLDGGRIEVEIIGKIDGDDVKICRSRLIKNNPTDISAGLED